MKNSVETIRTTAFVNRTINQARAEAIKAAVDEAIASIPPVPDHVTNPVVRAAMRSLEIKKIKAVSAEVMRRFGADTTRITDENKCRADNHRGTKRKTRVLTREQLVERTRDNTINAFARCIGNTLGAGYVVRIGTPDRYSAALAEVDVYRVPSNRLSSPAVRFKVFPSVYNLNAIGSVLVTGSELLEDICHNVERTGTLFGLPVTAISHERTRYVAGTAESLDVKIKTRS